MQSPDLNSNLPTILQAVVNTIRMPGSASEFACDLDGKGKKNAMGGIAGALKILPLQGMDMQFNIDAQIANGSVRLLFQVSGKSLADDLSAKLQSFRGEDGDTPPNPADDFSGAEPLKISPASPTYPATAAKITAGQLITSPGTTLLPITTTGGQRSGFLQERSSSRQRSARRRPRR